MMATDGCHVIYEIRITSWYFKLNPESREANSWRYFLSYHVFVVFVVWDDYPVVHLLLFYVLVFFLTAPHTSFFHVN